MKEIQFLMYDDNEKVEVLIQDETIWATQKTIAELFDVGIPAISKHLKNIFESGELEEQRTVSKMEIVQNEGGRNVKRETTFYNLDIVISVGYRVNSQKTTRFRIWATDVFAEVSYDYDKNSDTTRKFYATVQNKFHYAITGKTAAEIVYDNVDKDKEHMGLTSWKNSPDGRILQSDVVVAKNYLSEKEIRSLERY